MNIQALRKGKPLTQDDALIYDWQVKLEYLGITHRDIKRQIEELSRNFGKNASVNDAIWGLLNRKIAQELSTENLSQLYFHMAEIAGSEGKDTLPYLQESAKARLLEYQRDGTKQVRIMTANDANVCGECRRHANRVMSIGEAISVLPVPNQCSNKTGCRCYYIPNV